MDCAQENVAQFTVVRRLMAIKTTMQQDAVAELIEQENLPVSAVRKLLELVAQGIEKRGGNDAYIKAFKNAATFVRSYKPD